MAHTKTKRRHSAHTNNGLVDAAAKAAQELGMAAIAFKQSWDHIKKARSKGHPVTRAVSRGATKVVRTTKKMIPHRGRK